MNIRKVNFVGLSISVFDKKELCTYIEDIVKKDLTIIIYGHSLWTISILKTQPEVYYFGEKADVLVVDGRPLYLLAKMHGLPIKSDISIPNLVLLSLSLADKYCWSIFLLGSKSNINKRAQSKILEKYKSIKTVSGRDGYFTEKEESQIIQSINQFKPNILLIGMPSPKKEMISVNWKNKVNANIIIPCGGMIDVLSGNKKLAPKIIKKLGLASLCRLAQEPKRLFNRTFKGYVFIIFNFIPVYFINVLLLRKADFSIIRYYCNK